MKTKTCIKCGEDKILSEFYSRKDSFDGYRNDCKFCTKNSVKKNNELNFIKIKEKKQKRYSLNKNIVLDKMKIYYTENKESIKNKNIEYYQNNKTKINKATTEKRKERYKNDKFFALKENIRTNLNKIFRSNNIKKMNKTNQILGCTYSEFKTHIESSWEPWMNWDNYGLYNGELDFGWDIDHIIPISSAKTEEEIVRLNHHTNLQPLCSYVNRNIKRDSY